LLSAHAIEDVMDTNSMCTDESFRRLSVWCVVAVLEVLPVARQWMDLGSNFLKCTCRN